MAYVMNSIRSFVMLLLCLNPVVMLASEYNRMYYPIPGSDIGFGSEWGPGANKFISFPDQVVVIKVIIVGFLMFIVYKNKDQIGDSIKNSLDADSCIDHYFPGYIAGPLKIAVIPLKKAIQFLFGCTKKYIYNNKIYMVGTGGSCAIGYVAGFPMIGGVVGGASFVAGLVQSLRQELAELREENKEMHQATQEGLKEGFNRVERRIDKHEQKLLEEVGKLSVQIFEITEQINGLNSDVSSKIENVGSQVKELSDKLQKATEQMIMLHSDRDIKDAELFKKLEKTTNELVGAKESLVSLVTHLVEEASKVTKQEFEKINKSISQIDGKQNDQATVLMQVQQNISLLLDNRESDEKRFVEILDAIQGGNLSLEDVQTKVSKQEIVFNSIQAALDKMHRDRESFSDSISNSISQCSTLSERILQLESTVYTNHEYVKKGFQHIENKVDANQAMVIELLKKNNETLLLKMELFEKKVGEEKTILLKKISDMEEERKKDNILLNQNLNKTAKELYKGQSQILEEVQKQQKDCVTNNCLSYDSPNQRDDQEKTNYQQVYFFSQLKQQLNLANYS